MIFLLQLSFTLKLTLDSIKTDGYGRQLIKPAELIYYTTILKRSLSKYRTLVLIPISPYSILILPVLLVYTSWVWTITPNA